MANSNQDNQGKQDGGKGDNQQSDTSNRGFASMKPERQREIAAEGGRAAHASGNAHEFTSEEARKAGSMSHKNDGNQQSSSGSSGSGSGSRGKTAEQDEEGSGAKGTRGGNQQSGSGSGSRGSSGAGNTGNTGGTDGGSGGGTRGGTPEQHAEAGRQSHKNDR